MSGVILESLVFFCVCGINQAIHSSSPYPYIGEPRAYPRRLRHQAWYTLDRSTSLPQGNSKIYKICIKILIINSLMF